MRSRTQRTRFLLLACLSALTTALAMPAVAAGANPPIRFDVTIGSPGDCLTVITTANTPTSILWRRDDGTVAATGTLASDEIFFCPDDRLAVEPGDRIRASDGSYTRTFVVPDLSVTVDRINDIFHGTGPVQRTIKVGYGGRFGNVLESHGVRVDQNGEWSLDPGFDVQGGQGVFVDWKTPNGDGVHAGGGAPVLIVTLGSSRFIGGTEPFRDIEVSIEDGQDGSGTGHADITGSFRGRFRTPGGNPIPVSSGDHISAPSLASDADWVVPALAISADATTEQVTGQCQGADATSPIVLIELYRTGHQRGFVIVSAGSDGLFAFDFSNPDNSDDVIGFFSNPANVKHGDTLRVECLLDTGDLVKLRSVVP